MSVIKLETFVRGGWRLAALVAVVSGVLTLSARAQGTAQATASKAPSATATRETPEPPEAPETPESSNAEEHQEDVRLGQGVVVEAGEDSHRDIVVYGHPVSIEGTHHGEVTVFGGGVKVAGEQNGEIVSFGGGVEISGTVHGNISVIGGGVRLARTANITGDVAVVGGALKREPGAVLKGNISVATPHLRHAVPFGALGGHVPGLSQLFWHLLALLVGILVLAIVPARVEAAGNVLRKRWLACLGVGFAAGVAVFPLSLILLVTCVGALLPPAFYQVAKYFGVTVLFAVVGEALGTGSLLKRELTPLASFVLGLAILSLLAFVTCVSPLVWLVYGWFGVGCALLTRFGTMRPWFKSREGAAEPPPAPAPPVEALDEATTPAPEPQE